MLCQAQAGCDTRVTLTDMPEVVPQLQQNAELNAVPAAVRALDWTQLAAFQTSPDDVFDLIVAADVVWQEFFERGGGRCLLWGVCFLYVEKSMENTQPSFPRPANINATVAGVDGGFDSPVGALRVAALEPGGNNAAGLPEPLIPGRRHALWLPGAGRTIMVRVP
jgi:hypothetical protein